MMAKIYIDNAKYMEFIDDIATQLTELYSYKKCLDILIAEEMDEEDAMEHLSFNVMGAYVGEKTPIWCMDNYE